MPFLTDPDLCPFAVDMDGLRQEVPDLWVLMDDLRWVSPEANITIPRGFISDMASIPRALDWVPFLDINGRSRRAGLAHDGLYSLGRSKGKDFADRMLRAFCLAEGMSAWQADTYYRGVQWFGAKAWAGDAAKGIFGVSIGDFATGEGWEAWVKAGATVFR